MKNITQKLTGRIYKLLAFMSILAACTLFAGTELRSWGSNNKIVKKLATSPLPAFALVGFVASFKQKGITLEGDELEQYKAMDEVLTAYTKGMITESSLAEKFNDQFSKMDAASKEKLVKDSAVVKEIEESIAKQAILLDQLKTLGGNPARAKSLREQLKDQLAVKENKEILESMRNQGADAQTKSIKLNIKAIGAGPETISGTTAYGTAGTQIAFPTPEFIPGLNNVARNQPFLIQWLNVMPTSKENIVYAEKKSVTGTAAWAGENVAAPQIAFDIVIGQSRAKLVKAYIKVSTQMLDDIDYMASEIEKELIYQEAIKIDTDLLQGDGVGDNLAGIKSFASGYVLTSISTTQPNNADAVLAAAAQIAHDNFIPDIAVMNPLDVANVKLQKGSTGYYLINPNNENDTWANVRVIQSNQVPVGYLMVMDSAKTNDYRYQDFMLSYGFINDDFIKNMVTIMATQRLHSFIKSNDVNAFVYDTLSNIKTAITGV